MALMIEIKHVNQEVHNCKIEMRACPINIRNNGKRNRGGGGGGGGAA